MDWLLQNKESIVIIVGIITIIFHFKSLSKDFHNRIDRVNDRIDNLSRMMNDRIDDLSRTMSARIDGLYNLFSTQNKSK